jgi:histone chaperone ASF1
VVYVGSANSSQYDQTLDEILVGPIPVGVNKFILQADPPDASRIPENDILGVTVILVTCSYRQREFLKVGYYVNNEYAEEFDEETGPPKPLDLNKIVRTILADKPRVTKFQIPWGDDQHPNPNHSSDFVVEEEVEGSLVSLHEPKEETIRLQKEDSEENIESVSDKDIGDEEEEDDDDDDEEEEQDEDEEEHGEDEEVDLDQDSMTAE